MKPLIAIALLACLALPGCGPNIIHGTVVERQYKPAYTIKGETRYYVIGNQAWPMTFPDVHKPARWWIVVEGDNKDRRVEVDTNSDYNGYRIGDEWRQPGPDE